MENDLSPDDVAILIRAKRIQKEKGINATTLREMEKNNHPK